MEHHLEALEKRRPRIFGGIGARLDRDVTLASWPNALRS